MTQATLTISSKTTILEAARLVVVQDVGDPFTEQPVDLHDLGARQELLLLTPTVLVPRLTHGKVDVWDTLAIAEYLNESFPKVGLYPSDKAARAHCRSISGEMHSGFYNLRSALPMNLKSHHATFKIFRARPDVERVKTIWRECLAQYGGPFLFGAEPSVADAMYAPVCTRFRTYAVPLETRLEAYVQTVLDWAPMVEWTTAALSEPEEIAELEVEF